MVVIRTLSLALLLTGALAVPSPRDAAVPTPLLSMATSSLETASSQLDQLADFVYNVTTHDVSNNAGTKRGSCSRSNLRIRRHWRAFSSLQKKAFIRSVRCLQQLPARTPSSVAAGAKTLYDDFVATHIQQTMNIHYTVRLMHHGMIDRVWWIWQALDVKNRQYAISGTGTFLNFPASPHTTLSTMVDLGYANGGPIAMQDLMSMTAGPFCYVYL